MEMKVSPIQLFGNERHSRIMGATLNAQTSLAFNYVLALVKHHGHNGGFVLKANALWLIDGPTFEIISHSSLLNSEFEMPQNCPSVESS